MKFVTLKVGARARAHAIWWALASQAMTPSWGQGGVKTRAHNRVPLGNLLNKIKKTEKKIPIDKCFHYAQFQFKI